MAGTVSGTAPSTAVLTAGGPAPTGPTRGAAPPVPPHRPPAATGLAVAQGLDDRENAYHAIVGTPSAEPATHATGDDAARPLATAGSLTHGAIDDHVGAGNGIDAGDYPDPQNNFNGGFARVEVNRDYKLTGLTVRTPGRDGDPGTHAGVEVGGATVRLDESAQGTLSKAGVAGQLDLDNTVGINIVRGSVTHTTQKGTGDNASTLTVGARGYLQATAESDTQLNLSTRPGETPNGLSRTTTLGVGGRVAGFVQYQTPTRAGNLSLGLEAGVQYNVAGQTYGNLSNAKVAPYLTGTQSLQLNKSVTLAAREDVEPTLNSYRVAAGLEKDLNPHTTIGAYVGHQSDHGQQSNFAGAGITFKF